MGGMGSVWLAEHLTLRSAVAVKLMDPKIASTPEGAERFQREAMAAASLRSAHVVQVLDYGLDTEGPFLVMELLQGESLAASLERLGKLTPDRTAVVIEQVARAMSRAHAANIVHRDLKPDNIFLVQEDDREIVKVLDFGIAKTSQSLVGGMETRTGVMMGTPHYMSPEQAQGKRDVDFRTDLWSMAIVACECLTGARPFAGETFGELLLNICVQPIPAPSSLAPVPTGFDAWFSKAASRSREERFQSAKDLAETLRLAMQGGYVAAPEATAFGVTQTVQAPTGPSRSGPSASGQVSSSPASPTPGAAAQTGRASGSASQPGVSQPGASPSALQPSASLAGSTPSGPMQTEPGQGSGSGQAVARPPGTPVPATAPPQLATNSPHTLPVQPSVRGRGKALFTTAAVAVGFTLAVAAVVTLRGNGTTGVSSGSRAPSAEASVENPTPSTLPPPDAPGTLDTAGAATHTQAAPSERKAVGVSPVEKRKSGDRPAPSTAHSFPSRPALMGGVNASRAQAAPQGATRAPPAPSRCFTDPFTGMLKPVGSGAHAVGVQTFPCQQNPFTGSYQKL